MQTDTKEQNLLVVFAQSTKSLGVFLHKEGNIMSRLEFNYECVSRTLLPRQVIEESQEIREAMRLGQDETVRELLDNFA